MSESLSRVELAEVFAKAINTLRWRAQHRYESATGQKLTKPDAETSLLDDVTQLRQLASNFSLSELDDMMRTILSAEDGGVVGDLIALSHQLVWCSRYRRAAAAQYATRAERVLAAAARNKSHGAGNGLWVAYVRGQVETTLRLAKTAIPLAE